MQEARLSAIDLACRRGERVLFRGLSFDLVAGQALHVTGANGIGKSSLLRLLAGLLHPFAGTVASTGSVGLIDERPALDPHLPLGKALAFWTSLDRRGLLARESVADRLGLSDLLDVPVRFLSTGQRKRAAMTRLLAQGAAIWLLDEPLNGLDREGVILLESLAAEHRAAGGICVIASHQPIASDGIAALDLAAFA